MASLSSEVRLPVVARHKASRIILENSGEIGSLGEFTPNIVWLLLYINVYIDGAKVNNNSETAKNKVGKVKKRAVPSAQPSLFMMIQNTTGP